MIVKPSQGIGAVLKKYSKIVINEKEYHSLDEVPEHLRALLKDQVGEALKTPGKTITSSKMFDLPLDKIPEEMRKKIIEEIGATKEENRDIGFTSQTGQGMTTVSSTPAIKWILVAMAFAALIYSML